MNLFSLPTDWTGMSAFFIEGALLAANANPKPMEPEQWLPVLITGGVEELTTSFPEEAKMPYWCILSNNTVIFS